MFTAPISPRAGAGSLLIHAVAGVLLFTVLSNPTVRDTRRPRPAMRVTRLEISPWLPVLKPDAQRMQGGGGGDRSLLPPSLGRAPRAALHQFTPPLAVRENAEPKLVMEPTLVVQPEVKLPSADMTMWGDPLARSGPPSNGEGEGGGIGRGHGPGIGPGQGPGYGPGRGGGFGDGVFRIGGGVSRPIPIYTIEPDYSDEARKARFQGTVVISMVVDERGQPVDVHVLRPLGLGLDEKAVEAVLQWRFKPAMKDGRPVAVAAVVEVSFHLL